jgi:hypothetical protein
MRQLPLPPPLSQYQHPFRPHLLLPRPQLFHFHLSHQQYLYRQLLSLLSLPPLQLLHSYSLRIRLLNPHVLPFNLYNLAVNHHQSLLNPQLLLFSILWLKAMLLQTIRAIHLPCFRLLYLDSL